MKRLLIFLVIHLIIYPVYASPAGQIHGRVTDENGQPLVGANLSLIETGNTTVSNDDGKFFFDKILMERVTIRISFVGYATTFRNVKVHGSTLVDIKMSREAIVGDELVITASRRPEKITNAPAAISVISARALDQTSFFNPAELISKVQGVEFARAGVNVYSINARGFNNAYNTKILHMTDGRNSMMAGANGLPSGVINTVIKEDIERIEIELGPNSALYGPNAHNGIFNTITRDPRKYQGTTVALTAGNQQVFSSRLRHAVKINNKWAYKVTGEYTTGRNFAFYDSVYAGGGVFGPSVAIPEKIHSQQFRHLKGEAHLFYDVKPGTFVTASYGGSNNDYININNIARNQQQNWKFSYLQARYVSPHVFIQAYETWTNVGQSYNISSYTRDFWNRTHSIITDPLDPRFATSGYLTPEAAERYALRLGNMLKERSKRFNVEGQYNFDLKKAGIFSVLSVSYQKDLPKTYGTTLADADHKVEVTQYGGALQLEKELFWTLKLTAAARLDHHSLFGNMFSPKLGLVKGLPGGAFRLTWAKAFAAPIILFQRASAFGIIFGNGSGVSYYPNDSNVNDAGAVVTTKAMQPEQITTWEIGYKGKLGKKLYIDINGYYGKSKHFLSPAISVAGRVLSVGEIPISVKSLAVPGTVNESGVLLGAAFSTYFNYGQVASYGLDFGLNRPLGTNVSFALKYSWFGSDITHDNIKNDANGDGYVSLEERSLNAPRNRVSATLGFEKLMKGKAFVNLSARWVQQFDMYSGSQIATKAGEGKRGIVYGGVNLVNGQMRYFVKNFDWGPLGGFVTTDINLGYRFSKIVNISASISNILNSKQKEFVASPSIGRLYSVELKINI